MKYVYCLARDVAARPNGFPSGLNGTEVHLLSFEGISALISDVDSAGTRHAAHTANEQNALIHQEIVDAVLRLSKSIIPCRFGTLFPDDKNILMFLKEHYTRLDDHLAKLEGKVEVGVQTILKRRAGPKSISTDPEAREHADSGTSYLLKKKRKFDAIRELEEEADELGQRLDQAMSPFWSDVKVQKHTTNENLLLNVCYLVNQENIFSFRIAYHKFERENPGLKLLYSGPWPPYTFADIDLSG